MKKLTPQQIAQKWADKTAGATNLLQAGVMAVTENPAQKAAQRAQFWIDQLNRSFQEQTWQRGLANVTLSDWQQAMILKGIPVIADRVRKAQPKYQAFISAYLTWYQGTVAPQLASMPRGNIDQNIQRATLVIRASASMKGKFKNVVMSR